MIQKRIIVLCFMSGGYGGSGTGNVFYEVPLWGGLNSSHFGSSWSSPGGWRTDCIFLESIEEFKIIYLFEKYNCFKICICSFYMFFTGSFLCKCEITYRLVVHTISIVNYQTQIVIEGTMEWYFIIFCVVTFLKKLRYIKKKNNHLDGKLIFEDHTHEWFVAQIGHFVVRFVIKYSSY